MERPLPACRVCLHPKTIHVSFSLRKFRTNSFAVTPTASHLAVCSRSLSMRIFALNHPEDPSRQIRPELLRSLKPHTSPVVTSTVDQTGSLLATGGADGSIKVWDIKRGYATHTFHGHGGVISALCFFDISVDNGGSNDKKKRSSSSRQSRSQNALSDSDADPSTFGFRLASGSEEGKVRVWDLHKRKAAASLESHVSVVRSLSFSPSQNALLSASRDKTIIVWDARSWEVRRIIPVLESVEAGGFLADGTLCYTGGENGRLRLWDPSRGGEVTGDQDVSAEQEAIVAVEYFPGFSFIMTVHADQTLKLHAAEPIRTFEPGSKLSPLPLLRRISGNADEVIDLACVGSNRSLLALATNTEYIRLVCTQSSDEGDAKHQGYFGSDVAHLEGHGDIIICLDVDWSGCWLATGAKDNTARLWRIDPQSASYTCVATLTGHTESLGAVAFPRSHPPAGSLPFTEPLSHPPPFLFTGSQDMTIKRWDTSKLVPSTPNSPKAIYTRKSHEKDINALDVNHSSTMFASASQDRTAKIWSIEDGSILGILRGHKRGVWSVRFAPKDTPIASSSSGASSSRGLVATGSGDKTVKIWSLSDYSCLLTFEGHTNSVLKVIWLPPPRISSSDEDVSSRGAAQVHPLVASAGADGLVKVWSTTSGELETTLDNHADRVWALATPYPPLTASDSKTRYQNAEFSLISGAADATISFWVDATSAALTAALTANTEKIEQDQQLQNYIEAGAFREAITLALQLNHPGRLLSLFKTAIESDTDTSNPDSLTGNSDIDDVLRSLDKEHLYMLLLRLRDWNTNAKTSMISQRIMYALFKSYPPSTFVELAARRNPRADPKSGAAASGLKDILHALAAYTERHYKRVEELTDESYLVEWIIGEMDGGIGGLTMNGDTENDVVMLGT